MNSNTVDVKEFAGVDNFPKVGDPVALFKDVHTGKLYRYTGGKYVEVVTSSPSYEQTLLDICQANNFLSKRCEDLEAELAKEKASGKKAKSPVSITVSDRHAGYGTLIILVMWVNGFRYVETKWEMFFSLFGYTVYLSLIKTVDWFSNVFTGFFAALIEMMQRSGGPGI